MDIAPRSASLRRRPLSLLRDFLRQEAAGGFVLMAAAGLALIAANSPLASAYDALLHIPVEIRIGTFGIEETLLHWINDGLMAVFFLLVGLEIKREILDGHLSTWPRLALPGIAAIGGMLVPALIYAALNWSDPEALVGWAIPAATDIAFALGVLALVGRRAPVSLKVFLAALAILDDLGAIAIIALFYTAGLQFLPLALAALCLVVLVALNQSGTTALPLYLVVGLVLWVCVLKSGVHATLAGVALAMAVPLRAAPARPDDPASPLHRLEHALNPLVAFLIVPVFGFANAGLPLEGIGWAALVDPLPLGIALGLFVGKQVGVFAAAWGAIRLKLADLPADASWAQLYGVALLCGIGFTMSLFIGTLAFGKSEELMAATKLGVLGGSLLSAVAGYLVLLWSRREGALHGRQR